MTKIFLLGVIEFSSPLLCSADALGKAVAIEIGEYQGTLTFPSLPEWKENEQNPLNKNLVAPEEAKTWKRGDQPLYWGSPQNYPAGDSSVDRALLKIDIPEDDVESAAEKIYENFNAWLGLFEQYVTLFTTQNIRLPVTGGDGPGRIELYDNREDKIVYIPDKRAIPITLYVCTGKTSLDLRQLKDAISFSSSGFPLRLEYRMLLQAYHARGEGDYRKAIIEAATALEISLTERIKEEFQSQNISFGEALLKKYRMLGGRFELARVLGIPLPDKDYKGLLIEPRNEVIHKADFPTRDMANQVINDVKEILDLFSPIMHQGSV